MRSTFISAFLSLAVIITSAFAEHDEKTDTKFTSIYTDLRKNCKDKFNVSEEGHDMPVICNGPNEYWIDVEFSACCEYMYVTNGNDFSTYFPAQRFVTVINRKLEWRLADGRPFAVIFRIDKYKGDITLMPKKSGEVFLVKGLEGFKNINFEVVPKLNVNTNEVSRNLADKGYKLQMQTNRLQSTIHY